MYTCEPAWRPVKSGRKQWAASKTFVQYCLHPSSSLSPCQTLLFQFKSWLTWSAILWKPDYLNTERGKGGGEVHTWKTPG